MTVMTATPSPPTFVTITFDPDSEAIAFPDTAYGGIRPGSLDYLKKLRVIYWGENMMGALEPNTIPKHCAVLYMPDGYEHSLDMVPSNTIVYRQLLKSTHRPITRTG